MLISPLRQLSPLGSPGGSYWTPLKALDGESVNFWAKGRSGLTMPDSVGGNDIKILPAVFKGNGSGYYSNATNNFFSSDDFTFYLNVEFFASPGAAICLFSQGYDVVRLVYNANATWSFFMYAGAANRNITISAITLPTQARKYVFKITHDKDGFTKIYENGIEVGSASGAFTNTDVDALYFADRGAGATWMNDKSALISARLYGDLTETALKFSYIFTGGYVSDISGNGKHLTSNSVVAANVAYSANGSSYLLDSGHALWQKAGSPNIYIPAGGITTAPVAGYTLTKNYLGSSIGLNMAPCLLGFNETASADTELEIFDRSNITRQEDISRASTFYDATSLATKCRYHISEVYPDEVWQGWFKAVFKNKVFIAISKTGADFSLTEFFTFATQKVGSDLVKIKKYAKIDGLLTVGINQNVRTVNQAITRAYDDYTITIDAGTYPENIDLTTKKLNLTGRGAFGQTIIHYSIEGTSLVSTLNIATDSVFNNILFDKREFFAGVAKPIVNVSACNPVFINCQIGRDIYVDGYNSHKPMIISNGAIVTMTGSVIAGTSVNGTLPHDLLVTDTSKLFFEGTSFFACLRLQDTAEATIDTDYIWTNGGSVNQPGVVVEDDAVAYVTINIREIAWNSTTRVEYVAGVYTSSSFRLFNNGYIKLSGNLITGRTQVDASGTGVNVLFKDIISPYGGFWLYVTDGAITANATFDNCQIKHDNDSNGSYPSGPPGQNGSHIIEAYNHDGQINIINGCVLEFMANSGIYHSAGNPIEAWCELIIRNSEIIDHINENDSYGVAYPFTIKTKNLFDFENVIITNKDWDGLSVNTCLDFYKPAGSHVNGRLKNVVFNNSEINAPPINFVATGGDPATLDIDDYICVENVTNNSSAGIFGCRDLYGSSKVADLVTWEILKANCPD